MFCFARTIQISASSQSKLFAFGFSTTIERSSTSRRILLEHQKQHRLAFFGTSSGRTSLYQSTSTSDDNNKKARILFLGTPDVAATSLKSIVEESKKENSCFEVVGVVTQPPKRRKRRGKVIPSPVGYAAEELGIEHILCPEKANNKDFLDELEALDLDLCITAAYGQYLPKRFLATPKLGTLNIHPSLLPRWRGASPVQRSLEAGDNPVGVSVLYTVSKMDAGPILSQIQSTIDENDTATTVLPHLFHLGTQSLIKALPDVINGKQSFDAAMEQNEQEVVNADMIHPSEGELRVWKDSAKTCHDKTRGFSMWPGTFMYFKIGDDADATEPVKVKVILTRVLESSEETTDLVQMGPNKKDGLRVVCGDGSVLELLQVQPATRKAMDAKSFVNGLQGQTLRWVQPNLAEDTDPESS